MERDRVREIVTREVRASTNTSHEHDSCEAIAAQRSLWGLFSSLLD